METRKSTSGVDCARISRDQRIADHTVRHCSVVGGRVLRHGQRMFNRNRGQMINGGYGVRMRIRTSTDSSAAVGISTRRGLGSQAFGIESTLVAG